MYEIRVGAGKVCIDPPDEMYPMHTRFRVCSGKYNSCYCRAIVIDNGEKRVAIVSYAMSDQPEIPELSRYLAEAASTTQEHVLITVTHNHASPCDSKQAAQIPKLSEEDHAKLNRYKAYLIADGVEAVTKAVAAMQPARYGYGECPSYINVNRDLKTPLGRWVSGINPGGYSDKTLAMVKFVSMDGTLIAAILNHGTHASIGQGDKTCSSFPGITSQFVEEYFGNGSIAVWTSGAAGNQSYLPVGKLQVQYTDGYVENRKTSADELLYMQMEVLGRAHGADAVSGLLGIRDYAENMPIKYVRQSVELVAQKKVGGPSGLLPSQMGLFPGTTAGTADGAMKRSSPAPEGHDPNVYNLPEMEEDPAHPVELKMQLLMLGDIAMVCAGAELYAQIGRDIKDASPYKKTFVVTHSQEGTHVGYVPDKTSANCKVYECYGKVMPGKSDEIIVKGARDMFRRILAME